MKCENMKEFQSVSDAVAEHAISELKRLLDKSGMKVKPSSGLHHAMSVLIRDDIRMQIFVSGISDDSRRLVAKTAIGDPDCERFLVLALAKAHRLHFNSGLVEAKKWVDMAFGKSHLTLKDIEPYLE